jgi:homocysteine S-methyltransferase
MSSRPTAPVGLMSEPFTVVDGGLSTSLEELGHHPDGALWTAQLVIDRPEVIVAAHRRFVDAGADVVISSSYQASVEGFERAGLGHGAAIAALASTTDLARRSGARFVAASVGPYGAYLADGSEYRGEYSATWSEVRAFHRARLDVLVDTGADVIAIETIPTVAEAEIVLEELQRLGAPPAWLTFTCRDQRTTCGGEPIGDAIAAVQAVPNLVAIGLNCTDPRHVTSLLVAARERTDLPFVVYPNHGRAWDAVHKCWIGDGDDHVASRAGEWVALGARLIGGCCGVGEDGVRALSDVRERLRSLPGSGPGDGRRSPD